MDGRPVTIQTNSSELIIQPGSFVTLWNMRRCWNAVSNPVQFSNERIGLTLSVQLPGLFRFNITPSPPWYVRLLMPRA